MSYTVLAVSDIDGLIFAQGDIETSDDAKDAFMEQAEVLCGIANPNAFKFDHDMEDGYISANSKGRGNVRKAYIATFPSNKPGGISNITLHLLQLH